MLIKLSQFCANFLLNKPVVVSSLDGSNEISKFRSKEKDSPHSFRGTSKDTTGKRAELCRDRRTASKI